MTVVARLMMLLTIVVAAFSFSARADIGGIGSPVVPSNAAVVQEEEPAEPAAAQEQKQEASEAEEPLMVIRFAGQKHVYFERSLRIAVEKTEKAKAGASYNVVSVIPNGKSRMQNQRISQDAHRQLKEVVQEIRKLGIPQARLNYSTTPSDTVSGHEIRIYVN